jgi:hypothetical protein
MISAPTQWHARCRPLRYRWRRARAPYYRPRFYHDGCRDSRWSVWLGLEDVQTVILDRHEDIGLLWLLKTSRDWSIDFADQQSVILVRAG